MSIYFEKQNDIETIIALKAVAPITIDVGNCHIGLLNMRSKGNIEANSHAFLAIFYVLKLCLGIQTSFQPHSFL